MGVWRGCLSIKFSQIYEGRIVNYSSYPMHLQNIREKIICSLDHLYLMDLQKEINYFLKK